MANEITRNNVEDFYSQINFFASSDTTSDATLKNSETIEKIKTLLDSHRRELTDYSNQKALSSLADRFSVICKAQADDRILTLTKQLTDAVEFNESLHQWEKEDRAQREWREEVCISIKKAWIKQSKTLSLELISRSPTTALTSLPDAIGYLIQLETLNLAGNKLKSLPDAIGRLTQLKFLRLSNNQFENLPDVIKNFTNLTSLLLDSNKLENISDVIGQLTQLERLNLNENKLSKLPSAIKNLKKLKILRLNDNELKSLPDAIGDLTQLEKLSLNGNKLSNLPDSIKNLMKLDFLNLGCNELTYLPDTICQLRQLKILSAYSNKLENISDVIGQLTQLETLNLIDNKLSNLPHSIENLTGLKSLLLKGNEFTCLPDAVGQLRQLEKLNLAGNKLTNLPVTLGNLTNLTELEVHENPRLEELPMSLGQIPGITYVDINETLVPETQLNAILHACTALREKGVNFNLTPRLELWLEKSKKDMDLPAFLNQLSDQQQRILNEWLIRLEKTVDFKHSQQQLAAIVCDMLSTLMTNNEFKEFFFVQAEANNEACEDRAAMSLNEIYTYWKLCTLPENSSITEKLDIIVRAAKTFALRKAISHTIDEHQKKIGNTIEREAVEIYLYYETLLREKLNLLSAIQTMAYSAVGKRDWINEDILESTVEGIYKNEIVDYPVFKTLVEQDKSFIDVWEPLDSGYNMEMMQLYKQKASMKEGDFITLNNALMNKREEKWKEIALEWFEKQIG